MSASRITILHDSFGKPSPLRMDWGFAALIEFSGQRILFDTGNSASTFAHNCGSLGVDLRQLDHVVISHRHGDHTSGLRHLLELNPDVTIHTPEETFGVFGSVLPGGFYPRCHRLPTYMQYYEGKPPDMIRHGSAWPEAHFQWVRETTSIGPRTHLVSVISDTPGTREMREISLVLRTPKGAVVVAGCSHPGIERILAVIRDIEPRLYCLFGGLHLVTAPEPEVRRVAVALRDEWLLQNVAPGHCTGEPAFAALQEVFGDRYLFAGLGEAIELPG